MRAILIPIILTIYLYGAHGQTFPPGLTAYLNQMAAATENTLSMCLSNFSNHLTYDENMVLKSVKIKVDKTDWNISGTRAYIDRNGQRYIVFTLGYIIGSDYLDRAWADIITGTASGNIADYTSYVGRGIEATIKARATGKTAPAIKPFCEWSGKSDLDCRSIREESQYHNKYLMLKAASIAVILGHEIAHHVKGHLDFPQRRTKLEVESEADIFGIKLATKSGFNPVFGLGPFLFFASFNDDIPNVPDPDLHPPPICRVIYAFSEGFKEMNGDKGFLDYLENKGKMQQWQAAVELVKPLKDYSGACPS